MFDISIYHEVLRLANPIVWGRNFDATDLAHELYLSDKTYSISDKNSLRTALRNVARVEINTSVKFQLNHKIQFTEYQCRRCYEVLPISAFKIRKDKTNCSYVYYLCYECCRKELNDYYKTNKEKHQQGMAKYREENKEKIKAAKKVWYAANRERLIEKAKERQKKNKKGPSSHLEGSPSTG